MTGFAEVAALLAFLASAFYYHQEIFVLAQQPQSLELLEQAVWSLVLIALVGLVLLGLGLVIWWLLGRKA